MTTTNKALKLRIAHFIDTRTYGGAESLIVDFCRRTLESGDTFIALHFGENKLVDKLAEFGVQQIVLPKEKLYKSIKTLPLFSVLTLRKILKENNVDVLHSHLFGPICAGALAVPLTGIKHVGTLHDSYTFSERPARIRLIQLAAFLGTRIVSVSRTINEILLTHAYFPERSLSVIHNGTYLPDKSSDERVICIRKSLGISRADCVVITVGRLAPIKGHTVLLKAWKEIVAPDNRKLLIVGEGPEHDALHKYCIENDITDTVIFTGFRSDISDLLFASDIFVLSSFSEGLSCSIIEAIAHGLPCVVTDVGGNSEIVQDSVNGYLVKPGNIGSLSQALGQLMSDIKTAGIFSENSTKIAASSFSADSMFSQYWKLYSNRN